MMDIVEDGLLVRIPEIDDQKVQKAQKVTLVSRVDAQNKNRLTAKAVTKSGLGRQWAAPKGILHGKSKALR